MNFKAASRGVILILIGCYFLIQEFTPISLAPYFWPILLITVGLLLLLKSQFNTNHPS
jgi:uncharacterized membrane protein HdeD (DUF308 family)